MAFKYTRMKTFKYVRFHVSLMHACTRIHTSAHLRVQVLSPLRSDPDMQPTCHPHPHMHAPHAIHPHPHTPTPHTPLLTASEATWGPRTRPQAASWSDCCWDSCAGTGRVRAVRRLPHAWSRRHASARLAREGITRHRACVCSGVRVRVCAMCVGMCRLDLVFPYVCTAIHIHKNKDAYVHA